MDRKYTQLVNARDDAASSVMGVLNNDTDPVEVGLVTQWVASVKAARDAGACMMLAAQIPACVPPGIAFALLSGQTALATYVPMADAAPAKVLAKANKNGGLYLAKRGKYSVNLPSVEALKAIIDDVDEIRAAIVAAVDGGVESVDSVSVDKGNGVTQLKRVAKWGDLVIGSPEVADTVKEWLAE